jgi:hypothetical protein
MTHVNRNDMSAAARTEEFMEPGLIVQLLGTAGFGAVAAASGAKMRARQGDAPSGNRVGADSGNRVGAHNGFEPGRRPQKQARFPRSSGARWRARRRVTAMQRAWEPSRPVSPRDRSAALPDRGAGK